MFVNDVQLILGECMVFVEGVRFGVHLWPPLCLFHVGIFGDHVTRFFMCARCARIALCLPPNILIHGQLNYLQTLIRVHVETMVS